MNVSQMDLVEAAARLRVPWHTAHRLVLTGQLMGERRNGRWYVDTADLERLEHERKREQESSGPSSRWVQHDS